MKKIKATVLDVVDVEWSDVGVRRTLVVEKFPRGSYYGVELDDGPAKEGVHVELVRGHHEHFDASQIVANHGPAIITTEVDVEAETGLCCGMRMRLPSPVHVSD